MIDFITFTLFFEYFDEIWGQQIKFSNWKNAITCKFALGLLPLPPPVVNYVSFLYQIPIIIHILSGFFSTLVIPSVNLVSWLNFLFPYQDVFQSNVWHVFTRTTEADFASKASGGSRISLAPPLPLGFANDNAHGVNFWKWPRNISRMIVKDSVELFLRAEQLTDWLKATK